MTDDNSDLVAREDAIIEQAAAILERRLMASRGPQLDRPAAARQFIALRLACYQREVFIAIWLDAQCHVLEVEEVARGTIHQTHVYPREIVRSAIRLNACRVILAHNHPSGAAEFSDADRFLTEELRKTLRLIDVQVDDHLLVGNGVASLVELEAREQILREDRERRECEERVRVRREARQQRVAARRPPPEAAA